MKSVDMSGSKLGELQELQLGEATAERSAEVSKMNRVELVMNLFWPTEIGNIYDGSW
jgi:hypothetical protein